VAVRHDAAKDTELLVALCERTQCDVHAAVYDAFRLCLAV
jgi:hypothetical protein